METEIIIRNLQNKVRFSRKYIGEVIEKTIQCSGIRLSPVEISLMVVDNARIRQINRKYRKLNRITDVISFPSGAGFSGKAEDSGFRKSRVYGGDVFVSIERASSQAKSYGHSLKREMSLLVAHGILHLFGYDHMNEKDSRVMKKKEGEVLDCLNL